jgi:hypothetical protein
MIIIQIHTHIYTQIVDAKVPNTGNYTTSMLDCDP